MTPVVETIDLSAMMSAANGRSVVPCRWLLLRILLPSLLRSLLCQQGRLRVIADESTQLPTLRARLPFIGLICLGHKDENWLPAGQLQGANSCAILRLGRRSEPNWGLRTETFRSQFSSLRIMHPKRPLFSFLGQLSSFRDVLRTFRSHPAASTVLC